MAQNEPQRVKTPPGTSPNSPSLLFEYQCRSGKFIRLANRVQSKKNQFGSENRIESNRNFFARIGMLYVLQATTLRRCRATAAQSSRPSSPQSTVCRPLPLSTELHAVVPRITAYDADRLLLRQRSGAGDHRGSTGIET